MSLKLPPLFSDGMVLQRNTDVKIFGGSNPGGTVQVSFSGKNFTAVSGEDGKWLCNIGSYCENSEPQEMKITASGSGDEITIRDVLIGDVWLCSGQSNMELMLNRTHNNYPDEMSAENALIRQLKIPQVYDFNAPLPAENMQSCAWESFSPQTAPNFTAVGYFFAKRLHERYKVPIGLFACAVGGTPITAWLGYDMLKELNLTEDLAEAEKCRSAEYIEKCLQDYNDSIQDYNRRLNEADTGFKENWASPAFDDSGWDEVPLCEYVDDGSGVYWYRKTIEIPPEQQGKEATIYLGTCADMDEVFINGEKQGVTYYRYPPREYNFALPSGKLTIAIRLLCFNGWGGFTRGKNYFIATDNFTFDIGGTWKRNLATKMEDQTPYVCFNYKPTGLYNGMLCPLFSYAIKGIIWYQGESDTGNPERYAEKLTALINSWREAWGLGDLPFLQTQLAHYEMNGNYDLDGGDKWDELRARQKLCLALPKTGLALAQDLGEFNDLHPQNKRDVGERLARLAMRITYGEKLPPNSFEMYNC